MLTLVLHHHNLLKCGTAEMSRVDSSVDLVEVLYHPHGSVDHKIYF